MKNILADLIWRYMVGLGFILLGKSDPPPAPDYAAAATAQGQANLDAVRAQTAANRVNQYTPNGSLVYSQNPTNTFDSKGYNAALAAYQQQLDQYNSTPKTSGTGWNAIGNGWMRGLGAPGTTAKGPAPVAPNQASFYTPSQDGGWSVTQTLSPAQQDILDKNNQLNSGLLNTANSGLNYANGVLSKPGVDTSQLPQIGIDPGQSYQDAMMARLRPQIDRENQQSDAQLANQGITQGSQAYINAKTLLGQQHNDLLNNATVQGFNTGLSANQNAFQQKAYNQLQPINVINALRTGTQVQSPNFAAVPQQTYAAPADIMGATQNAYGAQVGNVNAQNAQSGQMASGLFSLAGSAAMAF